MLKLVESKTFKAVVDVVIPTTDPNKPIRGNFTAEFKHMGREALDTAFEQSNDDAEFLREVLVGVDGIVGPGGETLSPEVQMTTVLDSPTMAAATVRVFFKQVAGVAGKNSRPSRSR